MPLDPKRYCIAEDGLPAEKVGRWAIDKLKLVTNYVQASSAARRKYLNTGAAFVDVFCGPGRSKIRTNGKFIDGSPVAAAKGGQKSGVPFTSIEISDANAELAAAAETRLRAIGAPARTAPGPAERSLATIVDRLNPNGLHFALLDPHNLGALSFSLFERLARLKHVVHVSVSDLRRNVDLYSSEDWGQFDDFAPGWRNVISTEMNKSALRTAVINYWATKVEMLGLPRAKHHELISGPQNQELYWLIFLSRHELAHRLWRAISSANRAPMFDF